MLSHGLNFAVSCKSLPVAEFVTITESACKLLGNDSDVVEVVQSDIIKAIKSSKPFESNITRGEREAIKNLKSVDSIFIGYWC